MEKILEISNLSLLFESRLGDIRGYTQATDRVSLTLHRGETLGLVGESGSGKSVTALAVMGLLPFPAARIAEGSIHFFSGQDPQGVDLLKLSEPERNRLRGTEMGMIFQEPMTSLNPVLTCGRQVTEVLQQHRHLPPAVARAQALDFFEKVKLPDPGRTYHAYPHQLSGGQKQRVMIAMALCCHPGLLIADEPTTALDVTVQKAILELLQELKENLHLSMLFISHDLGVVSEICDRVAVMHRGRIVETGEAPQIFQQAQNAYTRGLAACRPSVQCQYHRLPTVQDFYEREVPRPTRITPEETAQRRAQLYRQPALLQVTNLVVRYPKQKHFLSGRPLEWLQAVDGISFDLFPGETLGIAGESGCGKSTLGRSIIGLTPAYTGQILYQGADLRQCSETELSAYRRQIQMVFQDPHSALNPRMTAAEAVMEPMLVHGLYENESRCREKTAELFHLAGLDIKVHGPKYPHQFSGGQRQRICIARALALNPRVLICDEITSSLDVSVQATILNLLISLREQLGLSYLMISHDLSVLNQMCDRLMIMKAGQAEALDYPERLLQQPEQAYAQQLIAAIPGQSHFGPAF